VAAALALRALLDPWLGARVPYITLFGAVIVAAWYGGVGPSLLAAALGYVATTFFFSSSIAELFAYVLSTSLIAALGGAMHRARERLEKSEEGLRAFMDHSPAYVLIKDEAGVYDFLNRAAERLLDLAPGAWRGKTGDDLLPETLATSVRQHDRQVLDSDAAASFPHSIARADGERHLYTTKFPLPAARGRRMLASVAIDVTEQRHAEQERQLEREQLRFVTDTMSVAVARVSAEYRYLWVNRVYAEWVGMAGEQIVGRSIAEVLGPEAHEQVRPYIEEVLRGAPVEYERLSHFARTGVRWIHAALTPTFDPAGRPNGCVVAIADIDELKRAQEQLQFILNVIPAAVQRCDRELRFLWLNPLWARWLGASAEEVVGRRMTEVLGEQVTGEIMPYIERALAGETVRYERLAQLAGIGPRWIEVVLVPTEDGFVSIGTDIHDRKLAEEALRQADRRKDEFLAVLAHELRNPLAPIRNAVALLRKKNSLDPEVAWSREIIDRQIDQLARLVDDLLDIERIARGRLTVRRQPVALEKVIDLALETSRPHINAAGHRLSVVLPAERVTLDADAARLAQVFSNILNNAAKYTEAHGAINVSAALDGADVSIRVEDSGIGFGPEVAARLFQPFAQLTAANERSRGGLGIGLTLAQGLVRLHGGTIDAYSEGAGQGARFTVRLPAMVARQQTAPEKVLAKATQSAPHYRVLVADDNRDAADSLQRILQMYGYEVRVAYDGSSAVAASERFKPRVAVLDIDMPGGNGHEVARALRSRDGAAITLIALTGWGQEGDRRRALEAGFDHHLTKPVDPEALHDLLAKLEPQ
jgi:PAS domain S-box-containing protein